MELTLMQNWVQTHLVYELLLSLPPTAHPKERDMLERIIKTQGHERGSLMTQIAIFQSEADTGVSVIIFMILLTHQQV